MATAVCSLSATAQSDSAQQAVWDEFFGQAQSNEPVAEARLFPTKEVSDTVECRMYVQLPHEGSDAPIQIMIECNHAPDKTPPTVNMGGTALATLSQSSTLSLQNGVETHKYTYRYKFYAPHSGEFTCRTEGLAFGGTAYPGRLTFFVPEGAVSALASVAAGNPGPNGERGIDIPQWLFFTILLGNVALMWFMVWLRFHPEGREDFAPFVIRHKRLPLSTDWALTHYGASYLLFFVAAILAELMVLDAVVSGEPIAFSPMGWFAVILPLLGVWLLRFQARKLRFKDMATTLTPEEVFKALVPIGEAKGWTLDYAGFDCIVVCTNPSLWTPSWGEQIFIVFDSGRVWLNSVNDLNKRTSIVSFGRNARNLRMVEEAIGKADSGHAG